MKSFNTLDDHATILRAFHLIDLILLGFTAQQTTKSFNNILNGQKSITQVQCILRKLDEVRSRSLPEILKYYLPDGGQFSWVPLLIQIQVH